VRNHIIDFLVARSKSFIAETPGYDPRRVPLVRPGLPEPAIASDAPTSNSSSWPGIARLEDGRERPDARPSTSSAR